MTREPPDFPPPWASAWGDDRFGLWAELEVNNVVQRLRWIEPGEFTMGSPVSDDWAFEDEKPAHPVRLTEGFWLADTVCTQALWLAVIGGDNPSHFSDNPANPVERVSWDDAMDFLDKLRQDWTEGVAAVLPTEAQWEYACRAGSRTRFHFGDAVHTGLVNFNGKVNYDDKQATLGDYRERTLPVKSLPPNAWGLYEMLGNVWEWCADGAKSEFRPAPYPQQGAEDEWREDPFQPPEQGPEAHRALRGGSWLDGARRVRSARRFAFRRDFRFDFIGFRLALRSSSPAGR